jgi:hypothetical protein
MKQKAEAGDGCAPYPAVSVWWLERATWREDRAETTIRQGEIPWTNKPVWGGLARNSASRGPGAPLVIPTGRAVGRVQTETWNRPVPSAVGGLHLEA